MRALVLVGVVLAGPCGGKSDPPAGPPPRTGDQYSLRGEGCRRELRKGSEKICDAVVVPRGAKPCEQVGSLLPGPDGEPQIETMFGSGCGSDKAVLAGPMGKELFFVETEGQGFIVLCDGARVDHIDEFAQARQDCDEGANPKTQ